MTQADDRGRRLDHFTARGRCGWCAGPFLRPVEFVKEWGQLPVLYCRLSHKRAAKAKRIQIRMHAGECPSPVTHPCCDPDLAPLLRRSWMREANRKRRPRRAA